MSLEVLGIAVKYWVVFGTGFVAGVWVGYKLSKAPVVDGVWLEAIEQSQKEIAEKDAMIAEYDRLMSIDDTRIVLLQHNIVELQAREKELVDLAKLTYGYLWHINAGLDAPAILNVTSITPEKCSHIVRKLWLDVLTKEQRGEGINKTLEALATVRGE